MGVVSEWSRGKTRAEQAHWILTDSTYCMGVVWSMGVSMPGYSHLFSMSDRPQRDQSDHASEGGRSVRWWESGESGTFMGEDGRKMGDVGDVGDGGDGQRAKGGTRLKRIGEMDQRANRSLRNQGVRSNNGERKTASFVCR